MAASVVPTLHVDANDTSGLCPEGSTYIKINGPIGGDTDAGNGITITLDNIDNPQGNVDFSIDGGLALKVFVKGGNDFNEYDYTPGGVASDTGLTTPDNASGGPAGVSHVSFCLVATEESVPESESPEGSVGGGTGTPAASVPDTAMSLPGFGGPLATLIFGAILVASLGTLAYANVRAAKQRQ